MSEKKSNFIASTTIPDSSTLDFVINGQNFKITKANFLTALGVTGTLTQAGAVTGTPVLDIDATNYKIRNLEPQTGMSVSVSGENGISIGPNLEAGTNVSIVANGDALRISAAVGAVANTVVVQAKSDLPAPIAGVITLAVASYVIKGAIDLGTDRIVMGGGAQIIGDTATLSSITSSSISPTITVSGGGFAACAISGNGGFKINNTGGGAAIRAQDAGTIVAIRRLFTSVCGTALEIDNAGVLLDGWTVIFSVNGIVMTGSANVGPILSNFNPISLTGKGIYINGNITSGALRINDALIQNIVGNAVEIGTGVTIQGMRFSGDATSTTGNGMKIAGNITGELLLSGTNILSNTIEGMDIRGGTISSLIAESARITAIAAGKAGLIGDAGSVNITDNAIFQTCQINNPIDTTAAPLSGITKKDAKYSFIRAGARITDSANIGGFTLDAQFSTPIAYQGIDGSIVSFSDPGGGVNTTVNIGAHTLANGTPISIMGTVAYNGLFVVANSATPTFTIVRTFVTAEVVGTFQTGWTKLLGSTAAIDTIERFTMTGNNELRSDDEKVLPMVYSATIGGEKSGATARLYQFALFSNSGSGFEKIDGQSSIDATNRISSTTLRVPHNIANNTLCTIYVRNIEGVETFILDTLIVDIGIA